jgi:hypothetical protein
LGEQLKHRFKRTETLRLVEAVKTKKPEEEQREVLRAERSLLAGVRQLIGIQELLTVMMVVAAVSSAIATWKATQIYARGERPYIGVASIKLSTDLNNRPYVAVDYRNFGTVPSRQTVLTAWTTIDGEVASYNPRKPAERKVRLNLGILSPDAPHLFAAYFTPDALPAIRDGKVTLKVAIAISYAGSDGHPYCYRMSFRYFWPTGTLDPDGGSDDCGKDGALPADAGN